MEREQIAEPEAKDVIRAGVAADLREDGAALPAD
jgi:hypothetical protein